MQENGYTLRLTLENHLKRYAEEGDGGARRLLESFHIVREEMHRNLKSIISIFPHYSEHDEGHSEAILSALERLLGERRIRSMPPGDAWAILVSAYMHDVGLIVLDEELREDWKKAEFQQMIQALRESPESDLREAARRVSQRAGIADTPALDWPVLVKRDVILLASAYYRGKHPQRARKNMVDSKRVRGLLDVTISGGGAIPGRIQNTIAQIAVSHGGSFQEMLARLEKQDSVCGLEFHPRYVAALLRLGDLCDLDNGRFNLMTLETFGELTDSNYVHYFKHDSVQTFSITEDRIRVISNVRFYEIRELLREQRSGEAALNLCHRVALETKNWFSMMESEIRNIKLHWQDLAGNSLAIFSPALSYQILVDGKQTEASNENLRFSFSNQKAYTLIEGYSLYDDQLIFVRELIQNSLDALKIQFWRDLKAGHMDLLLKDGGPQGGAERYKTLRPFDFADSAVYERYRVCVRVIHREGEPTAQFIIEDNGTGISTEDVKTRILNTGGSWHGSGAEREIAAMPGWLAPTGSFGIGLHAVFALSDSILIDTATEAEPETRQIILHSGKREGYVFMNASGDSSRRYCGSPHGTRLSVTLDLERWDRDRHAEIENDEDPLAPCSRSRFSDAVRNKVQEVVRSPLFRVVYEEADAPRAPAVLRAELPVLYQREAYRALFSPEKRNRLFGGLAYEEEGYVFAFRHDNGDLAVWQDGLGAFFSFDEFYIEELEYFNIEICCKGMFVQRIPPNFNQFCEWPVLRAVDLLGGDSRSILDVSRGQLTHGMRDRLRAALRKTNQYTARLGAAVLAGLFRDETVRDFMDRARDLARDWLHPRAEQALTEEKIFADMQRMAARYPKSEDDCPADTLFHWGWMLEVLLAESRVMDTLMASDAVSDAPDEDAFAQRFRQSVADTAVGRFLSCSVRFLSRMSFIDAGKLAQFFCNISSRELFKTSGGYRYNFQLNYGRYLVEALPDSCDGDFVERFASSFNSRAIMRVGRFGSALDALPAEPDSLYKNEFLRVFSRLPVSRVLSSVLTFGYAEDALLELLKPWIDVQPGNRAAVCAGRNEGAVLQSRRVELEESNREYCLERFPHLRYIPCDAMAVSEEGELICTYDLKKLDRRPIRFLNRDVVLRYCNAHQHAEFMPAFSIEGDAFGNIAIIAIEEWPGIYRIPDGYKNNYAIPLWMRFVAMKRRYGPRLASGEAGEELADAILTTLDEKGWGVPNLLRYIYHHNPFLTEQDGYDEAMRRIKETYRRFILLLLDCVRRSVEQDREEERQARDSLAEDANKP